MPKTWCVLVQRWGLHGGRPRRFLPRGRGTFFVLFGKWKFRLTFRPFVGMAVVARERWPTPGPDADRELIEWGEPDVKKKQARTTEAGVKHLAALDDDGTTIPLPLVEHCAILQYDDGTPRKAGWFTVKTMGSSWCVQVKDPDAAVSFQVVDLSLRKALESVALLLSSDDAPWEPDAFLKRQGGKGSK